MPRHSQGNSFRCRSKLETCHYFLESPTHVDNEYAKISLSIAEGKKIWHAKVPILHVVCTHFNINKQTNKTNFVLNKLVNSSITIITCMQFAHCTSFCSFLVRISSLKKQANLGNFRFIRNRPIKMSMVFYKKMFKAQMRFTVAALDKCLPLTHVFFAFVRVKRK
jgi:hypothetical protein